MDVSRRDFLKVLGVGTAAAVAGCYATPDADYLSTVDPDVKYLSTMFSRYFEFENLKDIPDTVKSSDNYSHSGDTFLMKSREMPSEEAGKLCHFLSENKGKFSFSKHRRFYKPEARPQYSDFESLFDIELIRLKGLGNGMSTLELQSDCKSLPYASKGDYTFSLRYGEDSVKEKKVEVIE
jgi:hypothetical protein